MKVKQLEDHRLFDTLLIAQSNTFWLPLNKTNDLPDSKCTNMTKTFVHGITRFPVA